MGIRQITNSATVKCFVIIVWAQLTKQREEALFEDRIAISKTADGGDLGFGLVAALQQRFHDAVRFRQRLLTWLGDEAVSAQFSERSILLAWVAVEPVVKHHPNSNANSIRTRFDDK